MEKIRLLIAGGLIGLLGVIGSCLTQPSNLVNQSQTIVNNNNSNTNPVIQVAVQTNYENRASGQQKYTAPEWFKISNNYISDGWQIK